MKRQHLISASPVILYLIFCISAAGKDSVKTIGNAIGESSTADGPASIRVDMEECQFGMTLGPDEHVKYNGPDLVLYRAKTQLADKDLPRLRQAAMPVGYEWWFADNGNVNRPWLGLMCSGTEYFKWSSTSSRTDIPPQLLNIMDSNSLKCPADFDGQKWAPTSKTADHFISLNVEGGQGFVVDDSSKTGKGRSRKGSRFCFVSGDNVLIGVSGGGLALSAEAGAVNNSVLEVLKMFRFSPVAAGK